MKQLLSFAAVLTGLLTAPVQAQVMLSIDGGPAIQTDSEITSIVYRPAARRLEVSTAWDDLRCVLNPQGPDVPLPIPGPGDFVFAIDRLDGDIDGEYVIEGDGSIAQLAAAIAGDPTTLSVVTSDARVNNCQEDECAVLVCAPGGTPVFSGDFEPIAADLGVAWDTDPTGGPFELVAGDASGTTLTLSAFNSGQLDATQVSVAIDVLVPASGTIPCPIVVSGGNGLTFDGDCSGTWTIGDLGSGERFETQLLYSADAVAQIGELATSDASIDSPAIDDINPQDNSASVDLEVVKQTELRIETISIPSTPLDLFAGPDSFVFQTSVTPQGPSTLNQDVVFDIAFPSSGEYDVQISDMDYNPVDGTWTPLVGAGQIVLVGNVTVNSFEPGEQNFCFGVDAFSATTPMTDLTSDPLSSEILCLDVVGPESIDLNISGAGDSTVVAGSGPGNAVQELVLTNNNATFDADTIEADLLISAPGDVAVSPSVSVGTLTQDGANPDLWTWSIATLAAGQSATATLVYDVGSSAPDEAIIQATLSNVTIDMDQILVDPHVSGLVQTTIDRQIDLRVTSFQTPNPVAPGGTLTYEYQLVNLGPSDASSIELDLSTVLPAEVTVATVTTNVFGTYSNGVWSVASLDGTATLAVTISVGPDAVPGMDVISATVSVTASAEDRINTDDDISTLMTSIAP